MNDTRQLHRARSPQRRGVALIMVLCVIAAAAILAWAMLSASATRSQIDANALDAAECTSLAESGASYAMHCLHYPDLYRPSGEDAATWFYPGQNNLPLWSDARGTVNVAVTSTGADTRLIRSTASLIRPGETTGTKQTVEVNVTNIYQGIVNAAGFNAGINVPANVKIYGPVVSKGNVISSQANFNNSAPVVATGANTVPAVSEVVLLNETGVASALTGATVNDRTYTFNGNTYLAEKAPATITAAGLTTARPAQNPCNVWYSNANVLLNNANFTGVLVVRNGSTVTAAGTSTLHNSDGMPALVVEKRLELKSTASIVAKLTVTGAVWVGDKIQALAPDRSDATLTINGALLWGDPAPSFNLAAVTTITYNAAAVSTVTRLGTIKTIAGLKVTSWKMAD